MTTKFRFTPKGRGFVQLIKELISKKRLTSEAIKFAAYLLVPFTLPVNPETLVIGIDSDNKTTDVVSLGQIVIPKGAKLSKLTIESFFPKVSSSIFAGGKRIPPYVVSSNSTNLLGFSPENFYTYFRIIQILRVPMQMTITDLNGGVITMTVVIDRLERKNVAADDDLYFKMDLIEYNEEALTPFVNQVISSTVSAVTGAVTTTKKTTPARIKTDFAIGDSVIVNGKYWYDSFGSSPYGTFTNFKGKISHIASNKNAKYKYHITTPEGGWRGWVAKDQLKGA